MGRRIATSLAAVAALAATGTGGYLIGHNHSPRPPAPAGITPSEKRVQYQRGREQGRLSGEQDGYSRGYNAGLRRTNQIVHNAVTNSVNAGYKAAFAGFTAPWVTGAYYIVRIDPGTGGVPYQIASRIQMNSSDYYDLCPTSGDICGGSFANLTAAAGQTPNAPPSPSPSPSDTSQPPLGGGPPYPAVCQDGTLSYSGGQPGACSHHGGEL